MSFVYPLGLLGLIGIPILIIIYIIKNKYTEQTIASVYIWKLSERFLKRKKPISKLQGLINLILQCLTVAAISLLIAQPSIVINGGAKDYCFILDGSASMESSYNDKQTRFDYAKTTITNSINKANDGSSYTLIYAGTSTNVIYSNITSKTKAISELENLNCSNVTQTLDKSIEEAQKIFDENSSTIVYLVTDKSYKVNNIELVNVGSDEINYAIISSSYKLVEATYNSDLTVNSPAKLIVSGKMRSYNGEGNAEAELIVDGVSVSKTTLALKEEECDYKFEAEDITSFSDYEVVITTKDSLSLDNNYKVYNLVLEHNYKALLVSNRPFYMEVLLESYGKIKDIDVITLDEYTEGDYKGYGLYIFDNESCPDTLPQDGTIWMFNPKKSVEKSGFSYLDTTNSTAGYFLEKETVYGQEKELISSYIEGDSYKMIVQNYNKYSINKNFKTLFSVDSNPVIFIGNTQNETSNREIVFGFELASSNLAMNANALLMFNKMLDYSFPSAIESNINVSGEEFTYNVTSGTKNIRLYSPSGAESYLSCSSSSGTVLLDEVGTYVFEITNTNNEVKRINVYNTFPLSENEKEEDLSVSLTGEKTDNYRNSYVSIVNVLFVILILIFIADWMVYCYEQHQLF